MSWSSIGTRTPTLEWQLYDVPVIQTETFRVRNFWTVLPFYRARAYLGQFFGTVTEVVGVQRIYPVKDVHPIIELSIPEEFKANGYLTRYIGIKLAPTSRIGLYRYDWQVELDEFMVG